MAVAENSTKTVTYLVTQKIKDLREDTLFSSFRMAQQNANMVRLLLSLNAQRPPENCDIFRRTSLHYAAISGNQKVCETLLEGTLYSIFQRNISPLSCRLLGIKPPLKFDTFLVDLEKSTSLSREDFISTISGNGVISWMRNICGRKDVDFKTAADYASDDDDLHEMLDPANMERTLPLLVEKWLVDQKARAEK